MVMTFCHKEALWSPCVTGRGAAPVTVHTQFNVLEERCILGLVHLGKASESGHL